MRHTDSMPPTSRRAVLLFASLPLLCGLGAGCAHRSSANAEGATGPSPTAAVAYYPLLSGWRWAYDVQKGAEQILATYTVTQRLGDVALVQAGQEQLAYTIMPDGIVRRQAMGGGDYVLRSPIEEGASWPLEEGEAKVVAVGRTVTVPAGTFGNCAVIEETRNEPLRVVRTTYAAGIGPVLVEVLQQEPTTRRFEVVMKAALRGVAKPGEDPLAAG